MPVMTDVATHCPYCALQCGRTVGPAGAISPRQFPTNRGGGLCRNGWTAGELLGHPEWLTTPLPAGRPVPWDEALDVVADEIGREPAALAATRATGCGTCADAVEGLYEADAGPAVVAGKEGAA
jgi:anaerobic selenocysteine-containing dehydrogenase